MGTFSKHFFATLALFAGISVFTFANDFVKQVIIVNEGRFNYTTMQTETPVTIATYDPATGAYAVFDTIEGARWASDAIIDGDFIYVAADSSLLKYDKHSLALVAQQTVPGIRNLAAWNGKILLTRGDIDLVTYQPIIFNSYFQVYEQADLSFDYEIDTSIGAKFSTQNIEVVGDKAYFIINNAYDYMNVKGLVGVVDLATETYAQELNLGPDGLNPDNLMYNGGKLYTLNNKFFNGSSVSTIDVNDGSVATANLGNVSTGCATSAFFIDRVWYQEDQSFKVHAFDPVSQQVVDSLDIQKEFYGMAVDPVNNLLYATSKDYIAPGIAYVFDANRVLLDSFSVGVSAGIIVFDVRKTVGIENVNDLHFNVFPNPANDILKISATADIEKIEIFNTTGSLLKSQNHHQINVAQLPAGLYFIVATKADGAKAQSRFIKE